MKKIIVPVDFSEQSENALKVAADLARKHDSEIFAVHMLEMSPSTLTTSEGYHPEQSVFMLKFAEKRFERFLDQDYLKKIKVTPIIKHFKVFKELRDVAEKHAADLVIMGSHGADGFKEIFVGSNTERVVRSSDIPVLVIKDYMPGFKIRNMVFASDFRTESIPALKKAQDIADKLGADIQLVYINVPGEGFRSTADIYAQVNNYLSEAHVGKEVDIYNDYSVERGVLNYCEANQADLIAIPTHGRKGITHFFLGSIGEDVVNHSKIPVITFKIV